MSSQKQNNQTSGLTKGNRVSYTELIINKSLDYTKAQVFVIKNNHIYPATRVATEGVKILELDGRVYMCRDTVTRSEFEYKVQKFSHRKLWGVKKDFVRQTKRYYEADAQMYSAWQSINNARRYVDRTMTWMQNITFILEHQKGELSQIIGKVVLMMTNLPDQHVTMTGLAERLLDIYMLYVKAGSLGVPQSLETLMFASTISFMPLKLQTILNKMTQLTNNKILDDIGIFHNLIADVLEFMTIVLEKALPSSVFARVAGAFTLFNHHVILREIKGVVQSTANPAVYADAAFTARVKELQSRASSNECLTDWSRSSSAVAKRLEKLNDVYKTVLAYESVSRVEPVCFGFEGPAGCGKSTLVSKLLKALDYPVYSHILPPSDKSDWYDHYPPMNSPFWGFHVDGRRLEHITMIDDLGQNGPSQYAPLMNLVSSVKMPLPCAEAHKKDTRFFNSTGLFFTTNSFKNISLVRADGIADKEALHRRVFLFNFSQVTPYTEESAPKGLVTCESFDVITKQWRQGPHADVRKWMVGKNFVLPFEKDVSDEDFLAWVAQWYTACRRAKESNLSETVSTLSLADAVNAVPQDMSDGWEWMWDAVKERLQTSVDYASENWMKMTAVVGGLMLAGSLVMRYRQCRYIEAEAQQYAALSKHHKTGSTKLAKLHSQVGHVEFDNGSEAVGSVSGHLITTIAHVCGDSESVITFYRDKARNIRYLDKVRATKVFESIEDDVAVWKFDPDYLSPFSKLTWAFSAVEKREDTSLWLVHPAASVDLMGKFSVHTDGTYYTLSDGRHFQHEPNTIVLYPFEGAGVCGSPIFSDQFGIVGHHIVKLYGQGGAKLFSRKTLQRLSELHKNDTYVMKDYEIVSLGDNTSGLKIRTGLNLSTPKQNSVEPGPLYGVFGEPDKQPANFLYDGSHTIKTLAKGSLKPVQSVNREDLKFAVAAMETKIEKFRPLTDFETIKGTGRIAGIDLSTSSGPFCAVKRLLVDKEAGCLTPAGAKEVEELEVLLESDDVDVSRVITQETLKAETRPSRKGGKPRSFRVMRFPINYLLKKYTGSMVEQLVRDMWATKMCIGFNPYVHFDRLRDELVGGNVIASDVGSWDQCMLPEVQVAMRELLLSKFEGTPVEARRLSRLLTLCISTPVQANDDTYLTTHSMPSGCYLTAVGNSIVHQLYTLMCFHSVYPVATRSEALSAFKDFVMGDDKICSVSKQYFKFDAFAFAGYMGKLGLTVTNSKKDPITEAYDSLGEVEFLKRRFYFHPKLQKYVGVLSPATLYHSIDFVDAKKVIEDTVKGKIAAFQIECYLDYPNYHTHVNILEQRCQLQGIEFSRMTEQHVQAIHEDGSAPYDYIHSGAEVV